ncbi:MAG: hypothetical protein ACOC58_00100 [Chloroflexota bacterium]
MGEQRVKDKTITPLTSIVNLGPSEVSARGLGAVSIGVYKGNAAFWDLDKAVVQPLVEAERLHILGILDGREEDYDLQTLAVAAAEAIGTAHTAKLTVPTGEVWFLNAVETVIPASGGANIITANWYCGLWTDRLGALGYGQPFHGAALDFGVGGGTQWDEFTEPANWWAATNKPQALRLPAGAELTVVFTNTTAVAAAAVNCIFRVYGWIGKTLVT